MNSETTPDMNPNMSEHEERINEAFNDLTRRSNAVLVDNGPHTAGTKPQFGGFFGGAGGRNPLIPAFAFVVLAAVVGFGGWRLLAGDSTNTNIATNDTEDTDGDSDGVTDDDGTGTTDPDAIGTITKVDGQPDLAFVLIETSDGTRAGYPSILNSWIDLPDDAQGALPDGEGGVYYTTVNAVVHHIPGEEPVELATSERTPRMVSARMIGDRQAGIVRVDNSLLAFFADGSRSEIPIAPDVFDGTVEGIAIDGSVMAVVTLNSDGELSVQLMSLLDGSIRTAVGPTDSEAVDAPLDVALAGDLLVVGAYDTVNVYSMTENDFATPANSFPMPAPAFESGWWSFDASGDTGDAAVIIGFGEAALTIDLDNGDRSVVANVDGWVRSAHWAFAPTTDDATTTPSDVAAGDRYRVDTAKVAADRADPFLNMRSAAGASQPLVAKLPPTYRGLRATGNHSETDDGATWLEFELLNPVRFTGDVPQGTRNGPTGWVNSALTLPLNDGIAVGLDEVPGCTGGQFVQMGGGLIGPAYVYGLESRFLSDTCLRVVLTVDEGQTPYFWDDIGETAGPASSLPAITNPIAGGYGTTINLGGTTSAWPGATETDDGVYIVRGDDRNLQLIAPMQVGGVDLTPLPELGILVVDLEVTGPAALADQSVVLTSPPLVGAGTVSVTGIARPFEATLGVSLVDADNNPVTAVFSGSSFLGTIESAEYGVMTNDWTEAWGTFAIKVAGLEPGQYTLLLDGQGGIENPVPARVTFTITDGPVTAPSVPNQTEQATAMALVGFAQGGSFDDVPLAEQVTLGLGLDEEMTRTRTELADRDNWTFDTADGFGGFSGPFNVLDILEGRGGRQAEYSSGPINHCAGPPLSWPAEWQALDQVNIEPVGIDSCIAWFGISMFLNGSGEIEVVVLDLFGP